VQQSVRYKVLVCGKTSTGKTSIIRQYIERAFIDIPFPTPLPMADSREFTDCNGTYELAIWDTAGAEEWLSMNTTVYHSSQVVVFVASFDQQESLTDLVSKWVPLLSAHLNLDACIKILAVNKTDLRDEGPAEIPVTDGDIQEAAEKLGGKLFEVSAKQNRNISEMFEYAAKKVRMQDYPIDRAPVPRKRKKCC